MAAISIRIDDATKKQFDTFCDSVGLTVSAAFNIFAKTVVREQRIPFEITTEIPNATTIAAIQEGDKIANDSSFKGYKNLNKMWADLEK
ncbi:MAG: type II toxin-antitoxin system RelB/DinJ family antitoxin [Treponema sp.]|jgi:DNA-damage-inducible protein J|nr:type II toxin-antitoxin system RelB/DinJ family antitoxin [Treponema sp.]